MVIEVVGWMRPRMDGGLLIGGPAGRPAGPEDEPPDRGDQLCIIGGSPRSTVWSVCAARSRRVAPIHARDRGIGRVTQLDADDTTCGRRPAVAMRRTALANNSASVG